MFAVAGVSDVDGRQLAVHPVAVVLAIGHAAGDAAVDICHVAPSFHGEYVRILQKYQKRH